MKKYNLILIVSIFSSFSMAGPVLSSSCPQAQQISTPKGAGGFYMSDDCKTAYILPPEMGKASVVGFTPVVDLESCQQVEDYQTALAKIDGQITDLVGTEQAAIQLPNLFLQRQQLTDAYGIQRLSQSEAIDINLAFKMNIDSSVQRYRDWNPNAGVNFQGVALKQLKLYWTNTNAATPGLAPVLDNAVAVDPSGVIGSGGFNAKIRLPLVSACALADPFTGMMPARLNYSKIAGVLAASVTYEYELQSSFKFNASYELANLAQQIKNVSTQGGFFSTASSSSLIESQNTEGWFKLDVSCDDSRVCDKVKLDQALTIKQDLMNQVLEEIALVKDGVFQVGGAPEPAEDGASKSAKELRKCVNVYCQAAAVILDVANSTFGGTNKTDTYINSHHGWQSIKVDEKIPVTFPGNIGFEE